jgi:hypothetical protein
VALELYKYVTNYGVYDQPTTIVTEKVQRNTIHLNDAKEITLSQYNPLTKDYITAHRVKDYRRKTFTLTLLPQVNLMFNKVLEGSDYFNECLQHARIHT